MLDRELRVAGCEPEDPMARIVAEVFWQYGRFGWVWPEKAAAPGASWQPERGGWVVYNPAWALAGNMPDNIRDIIIAMYLERFEGAPEEAMQRLREVLTKSYHRMRDLWKRRSA